MKRECILVVIAVMLICGCQQTKSLTALHGSPRLETAEEERFFANPWCGTTYALVHKQREAALPLIITTLDRLSGETNVRTRRDIIQGAFYDPAFCTNIQFRALIQRGTHDPAESVRWKTKLMVAIGIERLREAASTNALYSFPASDMKR